MRVLELFIEDRNVRVLWKRCLIYPSASSVINGIMVARFARATTLGPTIPDPDASSIFLMQK
jgi:hypothetical protein